ncbi:hypothetical protein JRQ81_005019 [Phrynocephalus forsythii]|uniref:Cullin-9 n=1 Tax=Phrynocephalus forsythii TaxID=171643 RepID=A0A9Q0Y3A6_9SAUR|nr:hypothetical protein JRQ81_005019 [Phrynocephalus forsythii]
MQPSCFPRWSKLKESLQMEHPAGCWEGSRAYVLLSLSQQDDIEQRMDFDSRYTLLELFAETTSSGEHAMSFEGIPLPQIPGKQLFSLVKRYLWATSLMDELHATGEPGGECQPSVPLHGSSGGETKLRCEFDFSMAMAHLLSELMQVMGWDCSRDHRFLKARQSAGVQSIFRSPVSPGDPTPRAAPPSPKESGPFESHSAFPRRSSYVEYLQEKLVRGMRVRMLQDYEKVCAGDEGEFLQSNNGTPPVQVYWESLGRMYWVHWDMIEIVGSSRHAYHKAQEKLFSLRETQRQETVAVAQLTTYGNPLRGLYSLPYLTEEQNGNPGLTLSGAEWWELLFFIKTLEVNKQQELLECVQWNQKVSELNEEGLIQMVVPVELAQQVLQLLSRDCQGRTQRDLQRSHVYLKYSFSNRGTEQNCLALDATPANCDGLLEAGAARKPEKKPAEVPPPAPPPRGKTDMELVHDLLRLEGLSFPPTWDEKAKAFCSVKVAGKKSLLEQLADATVKIQKSYSDTELQMAGLRFITRILETDHEEERGAASAEEEPTIRENVVEMLVELLNRRQKEILPVVLVLELLYALLAERDWRGFFATKGGLHSVLSCMQQHPTSASVQQAGLAVLKILLGAGIWLRSGNFWEHYPLDHSSAQIMQKILVSMGSAPENLLGAIPAAVQKMVSMPGASSAVQNGLLVLNKLMEYHQGLAEQLARQGLHAILQSCWSSAFGSQEMLAQIVLSLLVEYKLPRSQESADSGAFMKDTKVTLLLSNLHVSGTCKEMVRALEHCLHGMDPCLDENGCHVLVDVLLLKNVAQPGFEKAFQLEALRILNKCLDCSWKDEVPWHKTLEPCLSSLSIHVNDQKFVQHFVSFLYRLGALNKDCAVLMCCLGAKETLAKVLEKHSSGLLQARELEDLLSGCEKYAGLYKKMTISILAGCIQMVLGQIEEHRRSHQPINVPLFDVFLHNLCQGCSMEVKGDTCWERVEVSSNPHMAHRLLDGNPKTFWESNGTIGSHYIRVYMHRGVVVQQMSLLVATEDSSYMPFWIIVKGGESASSLNNKLSMVKIPPLAGKVIVLENMSRFWPVIQISIKRCQQGGIDTRVRGLEVLGPKPTFWPIFKEQLCRQTFLFYTTKAHTWCQEISDSRVMLLELFTRLNSALRHEQVFADRFLPDDEAAQALGETCWEALITPLVQSITSPDCTGISPLAWILKRYLETMEAARSSRGWAAIFNSHIRHLTHLLVHGAGDPGLSQHLLLTLCGPSSADRKNKELSSGTVKAATQIPSSIAGITQCWKEVVQQQVQRFLESSWQDDDFVEQYCGTYLRLCTAMEELFGQQVSFMLALCQGFSGALLQLSFLTAMHVSEQFARYIDQRIQESWADSGNAETLQRLQQSLEPILFLSGLELANTFEHFYRYYLGDRLLSQGKTWLESAVVEHIGLCFPNRFPQQMLKNLSELEQQQQQFHLFQLHQLDKHLLELDQTERWKKEGKEQIIEGLPFSPEEDVEVKVLALSPRCWTISPLCYLEEPDRFFPPFLSQCLVKFADFYTQSQSRFGLEHTKPRRLQWTWLGHAELQYQGCLLHVSTLQMYILLCFNDAEEVSVETLAEATDFSPVVLSHALEPLTKENGILMQHLNVLKLNKGSLLQPSGQHLRLLPKPAYLNGGMDEKGALERKRNTICGLITQILKDEKEMHVDKLVFKVMDAYQKRESGSDLKPLSACCCSSADVLSCVLHLLHQGSIRRQQNRPQRLEHVPTDPPAPALPNHQPRIAFQTVQIKKVPSMPCVEKRQAFSTFR